MRARTLLSALAAVAASAVIAAAGTSTLFDSQRGDRVFPMTPTDIGDPTAGGMAPVNGSASYFKVAPLTGFAYTFGNYQQEMAFRPAGTLAVGYVTMAPAPVDGAKNCAFSTQIITLFYPTANAGQTLQDAVTTLAANGRVCYLYSKANTTWNRSQ